MALPFRAATRGSNAERRSPDAGFLPPGRRKPAPRLGARQSRGSVVRPNPTAFVGRDRPGGPTFFFTRRPSGTLRCRARKTRGPPPPSGVPRCRGLSPPPTAGRRLGPPAFLGARACWVSNAFFPCALARQAPPSAPPKRASPAWARAIGLLNVARPFGRKGGRPGWRHGRFERSVAT